jgi:DUF438 domain-containing protein
MMQNMTLEQVVALLDVLPMELVFIDANDNVRFWNRAADRGPAWQPAALGGPVQSCHKDSSVHMVNRVLDKLKSGARDVVNRRVTADGASMRFRWFALRDETGAYLGTIEMIQRGSEVSEDAPAAAGIGGKAGQRGT